MASLRGVHRISCNAYCLLALQNFLHIACRNGSVKTLKHVINRPPPLLPVALKELFMAADEV